MCSMILSRMFLQGQRQIWFFLLMMGMSSVALQAQSFDEQPPASELTVQQQYQHLLDRYGRNARYRAAAQVLSAQQGTACPEYCARLHSLLAEEALLEQRLLVAQQHYQQILAGDFVPDRYTEGVLLARVQLDALGGMRRIALAQERPDSALYWHQRYVDSIQGFAPRERERYRMANDKWFAICYQQLGDSERAMAHLAPHALGGQHWGGSVLDKEMVHWLVDLLRSKYGKKAYRQFVEDMALGIHHERTAQGAQFYLQIWDNRVYFENDSANYRERVAANPQLAGQATAHYQRKLFNSYFYQRLLEMI